MTTSEEPALASCLLRGVAAAVAVVIALVAVALFNNNFSLIRRSRADFNVQVDASLDRAIAWVASNNDPTAVNPSIMYMVADIEKMTGDLRLLSVLEANKRTLSTRYAAAKLTPFWMRFADPRTSLPFITTYELSREGFDRCWFAYAVNPDKAHLSDEDLANLFSLTKYVWGARHHPMLALIMYRDFNGDSEKVDHTLRQLCKKEARDQRYDFRVTDAYIQRNCIHACRRPARLGSQPLDRADSGQSNAGWLMELFPLWSGSRSDGVRR